MSNFKKENIINQIEQKSKNYNLNNLIIWFFFFQVLFNFK
jgi:hypothetical protein